MILLHQLHSLVKYKHQHNFLKCSAYKEQDSLDMLQRIIVWIDPYIDKFRLGHSMGNQ